MKKFLCMFLVILCFMMVGCSNSPSPTASPSPTPTERTVTVTDMSGDTITVMGEVKRIVNLWPAGTSSFFALGAGDLVVGLASVGSLNEWVKLFYPECVNIGNLGGTTPAIEEIVKLDPDLVIIHPSSANSGYAQQIRDAGIPAMNINFDDYDTMAQAYEILGKVLGGEYEQKLTDWRTTTLAKVAKVREWTKDLAEADKPVLFYIAGQSNNMTTTMPHDSIFSDWAESAGAIYGTRKMNMENAGTEVTAEAIFALNPDIIICGGVFQHVLKQGVETTDGWKELNAVKEGRVYTNPYACFNWDRFGLESQLQIDYALMCIQPEIAQTNGINRASMITEIMNFYKTYTNFDLTEQQATYMLDGLTPAGVAENPVN